MGFGIATLGPILLLPGRMIQVGQREVRVGGVAPAGFESLPGRADAWVLERDADFYSDVSGFVVAHLVPSESHYLWSENGRMTSVKPDGSKGDFLCVSLNNRVQGPWAIFMFSVFLAFLALPATTSLPLGEYRYSTQKVSWSVRLRRWGFLGAKLALLLLIAFFFSLDMAYGRTTLHASSAEYIQPDYYLLHLPVWAAVDSARPAAAVPGVPEPVEASGEGGAGVAELPGVEWDGADLHGRAWVAACSGPAYELVQHAAVDLPGCFVGRAVL